MQDLDGNHALSTRDAFWLHLEHPGLPMNVAAVCEFDGRIDFDDCARYIESQLPQLPHFRDRLEPALLRLTSPRWTPDRSFNIRNHVRQINLKTGSIAEWKSTIGRILGLNLEPKRPLWDVTLVQGLQPNKTGLVLRIHHSVVDGVAGVGLLKALLKDSPDYKPVRSARRGRVAAAKPGGEPTGSISRVVRNPARPSRR